MRFWYLILIWLAGLSPQLLSAQDTVLVVPYGRFDFYSALPLEEIAEINKIKLSAVYAAYGVALREEMESYQDGGLRFVFPDSADLKKINIFTSYEMKRKPFSYYGVNVMRFTPQDFRMLLKRYHAKQVVFINWYHIKKTRYQGLSGKGKSKFAYSYHYVDIDLLDDSRNWIGAKGKFELKSDVPNKEVIGFKNLRLKEVRTSYKRFAGDLEQWILKAIKKE